MALRWGGAPEQLPVCTYFYLLRPEHCCWETTYVLYTEDDMRTTCGIARGLLPEAHPGRAESPPAPSSRGHLLSSLDSFPGGRQLYQNPVLADPSLLVQVDEALGAGHHSILIEGEPAGAEP